MAVLVLVNDFYQDGWQANARKGTIRQSCLSAPVADVDSVRLKMKTGAIPKAQRWWDKDGLV